MKINLKTVFKKGVITSLLVGGVLTSAVLMDSNAVSADEMSGTHTPGLVNTLSLADIYRGDIFVVSNPGGNYGTYTHSAIAYSDTYNSVGTYYGTLIESTVGQGNYSIITFDMAKIKTNYNEATLLRMKTAEADRILTRTEESALAGKADWYRQNSNGAYSIRADVLNTTVWYCSKLVYRVAYDMTIDMGGSFQWGALGLFVPDDVYASTKTALIRSTTSNGVPGFSDNKGKDDVVNIELEAKIQNGEVELVKKDLPQILKNRIEVEKRFMKENNINDSQHINETKELIQKNLKDYKNQLQKVKNNPESLRFNKQVNPQFNIDNLIVEADQLVIE